MPAAGVIPLPSGSIAPSRKVADRSKNKTGGSRPARRLTFFSAKKVSKNALFYFCRAGSLPLLPEQPNLRGGRKGVVPGLADAHTGQTVRSYLSCIACLNNNRCRWPFPSGQRRCGLAHRAACRSLGCFFCWPEAPPSFGGTGGTSTLRTLAAEMPAAGDALSAYSLERQRVRRRPGAKPRTCLIRPQGRKQNQKQNRRVASRQTPYFFQREKSKQKRFALLLSRGFAASFSRATR